MAIKNVNSHVKGIFFHLLVFIYNPGFTLTLLTSWISELLHLNGSAACIRKSQDGLTYKADNISIHTSNLRAASALPN